MDEVTNGLAADDRLTCYCSAGLPNRLNSSTLDTIWDLFKLFKTQKNLSNKRKRKNLKK
jgi:hypothetical protein